MTAQNWSLLTGQAEALYKRLRHAVRDAIDAGDVERAQRIYNIQRRACVRWNRRTTAWLESEARP